VAILVSWCVVIVDYRGVRTVAANSRIRTAVIEWAQLRNEGETNVAGGQLALRTGRNVLQFGT
jgi:hypothetical protein